MLDRLRQSLAFRLAGLYALVFALVAALLFGALYWTLAPGPRGPGTDRRRATGRAAREGLRARRGGRGPGRDQLERLAGGPVLLRPAPDPPDEPSFVYVPPNWVQTRIVQLPLPPELGLTATRRIETVRIPQDALRDYAVATAPLDDGSALQVGRSTDSRAVLLRPLRRAFAGVGVVALALSLCVGDGDSRGGPPGRSGSFRATGPEGSSRTGGPGRPGRRHRPEAGSSRSSSGSSTRSSSPTPSTSGSCGRRSTTSRTTSGRRSPGCGPRPSRRSRTRGRRARPRDTLADCIDQTDRLLHVIETLLDISAAEAGPSGRRERLDLKALVSARQTSTARSPRRSG